MVLFWVEIFLWLMRWLFFFWQFFVLVQHLIHQDVVVYDLFLNLSRQVSIFFDQLVNKVSCFLFSHVESGQTEKYLTFDTFLIDLKGQSICLDFNRFTWVNFEKLEKVLTRLKQILELSHERIITVGAFESLKLFCEVNFDINYVFTDERAVEVVLVDFMAEGILGWRVELDLEVHGWF